MTNPILPSVAVLVPLYQATLSLAERASLVQCIRVLGTYPIILIKPAGLEVGSLLAEFSALRTQNFADDFFTGTDSYNRLLTSPDFYLKFAEYEYVLIHQLDAYVFRDELPYWCGQKLDYIGAPSVHQESVNALAAGDTEEFARTLSGQRLVFNGGLSLRRVRGLIRYLKIYQRFYPPWLGNEDMLFSREATRLVLMKPFIRLPTWQQALRFSFEKSPAASYELTQNQLPFGCHAWERYDPAFWQTFIAV